MAIDNSTIIYIINSVTGLLLAYCVKQAKQYKTEAEAVKLGVQAVLRAQMISQYNHALNRVEPAARIYEKENFEHCYKQYHNLGGNGTMTHIYEEYMSLPTK